MDMIIVGIFAVVLFGMSFYLVSKSLDNLDFKFNSYYDFGKYFPDAGKWSIILFIVFLLVIITLFAVFVKFDLSAYKS